MCGQFDFHVCRAMFIYWVLSYMCSPTTDEVDTFKSPPPREDEMSQVSEIESDDAPSAPPLSPRMYPDLPSSDTERENVDNFQVPVIPTTPLRYSSDINQQRVGLL